MPTFRPPLYHTSEVISSDATSSPFARLTFTVKPDDEHVDGVYQLWTDLPSIDKDGRHIYGQGEWHETTFQPLASSPASSSATISSATFSLNARASPSPAPFALYAIIYIPVHAATYSYTLRQVKASGEIVWLGSDGSNGIIHVKEGEKSADVSIESGKWDGAVVDIGSAGWTGIAVIMDQNPGPSSPSVIQLPSAEPINASMVVGVGIHSPESIPFFQLSADSKPHDITRNIALAVASAAKTPLDISSSSILPSSSQVATFGRSESASLSSAVLKSLAEQAESAFKVVDSSDSHVLLSPAQNERTSNANLVLLAYSPTTSHTVSVKVPAQLDSTSPILCQVAASRKLLRRSSSTTVDVSLNPGLIADVFRFTEMSELRIAGGKDSIWICAPSAQSVQVGEEEFGGVSLNGEEEKEDNVAVTSEYSELSRSVIAPSEADTELPTARDVGEGESEYEAGDEDESTASSKAAAVESGTSWFFRMLDSFLVRIWSWIFSPIHAQIASKSNGGRITADGDAGAETEGETAVESPTVDERTPLLTTPGLSRSTSSTFNSPLNSPESAFTIKAEQKLETYAKGMTSDDDALTTSASSNEAAYAKQYAAGSVAVRSYTQFTFTSAPPFTFYLPSADKQWQDKVKFSLKTLKAAEWSGVDVAVIGEEGGAVEAVVGKETTVQDGDPEGLWQVQVERL